MTGVVPEPVVMTVKTVSKVTLEERVIVVDKELLVRLDSMAQKETGVKMVSKESTV